MREGWTRSKLRDFANESTERVALKSGVEYRAVGVLRDGKGLLDRSPFVGGETTYKKLTPVHEGQLILRSITAWEAPSAVAGESHEGAHVSGVFPVFDLDSKRILPGYMNLLCQSPAFWDEMRVRCTGTVLRRKTLSATAFLDVTVVLPTLDEQRRIVDLIAAVNEVIEMVEQEVRSSNQVSSSIRESRLMACETAVALGTIIGEIDAGKSPPAEKRQPREGELGVLKVSAVRRGWFDPSEVKAITSAQGFPPSSRLRDGDLLITRANTRELVGSVCRVDTAPAGYFLCDKTLRINPIESLASADYLLHVLQSRDVREQIENAATGTSGSMKNISQDSIRQLVVPLLPRAEQDTWTALLTASEAHRIGAESLLAELRKVRSALLVDLLSGHHEIPASYDELLSA